MQLFLFLLFLYKILQFRQKKYLFYDSIMLSLTNNLFYHVLYENIF